MNSHPTATSLYLLVFISFLLFQNPSKTYGQLLAREDLGQTTASISPDYLQFNVGPGMEKSQRVEIWNNTDVKQVYRVVYRDFELLDNGEVRLMDAGAGEQSLAELVRITPDRIEVDPGGKADVMVNLHVPSGPENSRSAWGVVMIEQTDETSGAEQETSNPVAPENSLTSTLAYSVWVYQNPPDAENRNVDITNFIVGNKARNKGVYLKVKNKGDGISFCNAYVEITNLATGEQILIEGKQYTLLPGARRTLLFELAEELPKGSYSAVGVLDYDNKEEMVATELEFKID